MLKQINIIFISDLHSNEEYLEKIFKKLKTISFDLLVLGGDISENKKSKMKKIINKFVSLKKEVVVFGGSHEQRGLLKDVAKVISEKHDNLINATEEGFRVINFKGYDFVFIPGSDVVSYVPNFKGGNIRLINDKKSDSLDEKIEENLFINQISKESGHIYFKDIVEEYNYKHSVDKKKTIVFSHIPFLCKTSNGIDKAVFGYARKSQICLVNEIPKQYRKRYEDECLSNVKIEKGSIFLKKDGEELIKMGFPIIIKEKNVGSKFIRKFLRKNGIVKFVCGHIHEAGPKCINKKEKNLRSNVYYNESFINSGEAQKGFITLLILDNGLIKHRFIKV